MAAAMGRLQIGLKKTGTTVTVPNNPKAKLMYYLDCICNVLNLDSSGEIRRLRDYENHWRLSEDETNQLLILCLLISPDELINKCIFHSDEMCGDSGNEFYELSAVNHTFVVTDSIMIGGERKRVKEIMCFKMSWIEKNFINPIKSFESRIQGLSARNRQARRRESDSCTII
ncbi:uncharacterized protein LOC106181466 [Lingula anatina]|uniref:Uncharacterized protein LOC106181466 n=1 Tax=Lingula anatina TaxID=7574 RepID=A0A1S3KFN7_LINAN|nr:uncharacterized protein LOC106181466 [Lingula anatina]|eukprot:XP_013421302.1 uncharacterized protein LOC106181466 [Lingula anatina]